MTTRLYKWMLPGMLTPAQKKPWPVAVGEWTPRKTPVFCRSGWHGVLEKDVLEHLPSQLGAQLWVVKAEGIVHGDDKFAAERMRLIECIGTTDEINLRLFACDVSEDVLDIFESKYPNDSRPRNAIEVARRFAHGEDTREELAAARDAAWAAARDSARDAAWAAAGAARDAAWAAAGAARAAAGAAAGADAWAAAWAAAGDAARARYSNWLVVRLESGC